MGTENRTADQDRIALRKAEALSLRARGKTFQEIADALGVSLGTAHHDVRSAMAEYAKEAESDVQAERGLELRRLERALSVVEEVLLDGADDARELRLKALDRLVKIQEQRAKLLGLYAPEKRELNAKVEAVGLDELQAMRRDAEQNECSTSSSPESDEPEPNS